jgi:hypothetical protein
LSANPFILGKSFETRDGTDSFRHEGAVGVKPPMTGILTCGFPQSAFKCRQDAIFLSG